MRPGDNVIVRDDKAGVFCGTICVFDHVNNVVELWDARKLWSWTGALAVEDLAVSGCGDASKVTAKCRKITCCNVVQICLCEQAGYESIMAKKVFKP